MHKCLHKYVQLAGKADKTCIFSAWICVHYSCFRALGHLDKVDTRWDPEK